MRRLSLKMKLAVGFGSLLLVMVVIGGLSYYSLRRVVELSTKAAQKASAAFILRNIESRINDQKAEVRGFLLDNSCQEELERYANNGRILADDFSKLESLILTEKGKQMLAQLREGSNGYNKEMERGIELRRAGKAKEVIDLLYQPQTVALRDQTARAVTALVERAEEIEASTRKEQMAAESLGHRGRA